MFLNTTLTYTTKLEYFENGLWIEYKTLFELEKRSDYNSIINRSTTTHGQSGYVTEKYYLGATKHRLDGPAIADYDIGIPIREQWYVEDHLLHAFEDYVYHSDPVKILFEYVKNHGNIKEVSIITRHNNWLNEDQLLLLQTMHTIK